MRPYLAVIAVVGAAVSMACISVTSGDLVEVASERALIVWNPTTKTEYFVREAEFNSKGKAFGFLVPTPTKPVLTEGTAHIYRKLDEVSGPRIVTRHLTGFTLGLFTKAPQLAKSTASIPGGTEGTLEVLGRAHVAGYDAVMLRADNPTEISAYLKVNRYVATKDLIEWLKPYVERKWVITAFKVAKQGYLQPVCMAFKTEEPFYPYKEPASAKSHKGRLLRVYFISDQRYDATLQGRHWNATAPFSKATSINNLLKGAGIEDDTGELDRLTVFEDRSNPRLGVDDLFFRAGIQDVVKPPRHVRVIDERVTIGAEIWGPAGAVLLSAASVFALRKIVRRNPPAT
jgi:hypothetical protein